MPQVQKKSDDIIFLKVKAHEGEELHFKIKSDTPLKKLMEKYSERIGVSDVNNLNFLYDGTRISATNTPQLLGMSSGDEIEVAAIQIGGGDN
jgi:small ubiquitin-related modifier